MKINRKEPIYLLILLQFVRMLNMGGYTKYLIPLGLSMLFVIYGKDTIKRNNAFILVPGFTYVFFGLMSSFMSGFLDSSSIKTGILLTISSVSVLFLYEKIIDHEIDICRVLFLAFAIYTATFFTISFTRFSVVWESTRAFIYGAFVIYFLIKDDWLFCAFAAVFCYISDKRIALVGVVAAVFFVIAVAVITRAFRIDTRRIFFITAILGTVTAYTMTYLIHTGLLVGFLEGHGISSTGRDTIWGIFRQFAQFAIGFTGQGLGFVTSKLEEFKISMSHSWFKNLHSDFYTGYIDLGFFGFGIWILSYFWAYGNLTKPVQDDDRPLLFAMGAIVYTFILYLTDNVLIYYEYWFPVNIMLLDLVNRRPCDHKEELRLPTSPLCNC